MNNTFSKVAIWMVIGLVLFSVFRQFDSGQRMGTEVSYSQFMEEARQGRIRSASIDGRIVKAQTTDERIITVNAPQDLWMVSDLMKYGVSVSAKAEEQPSLLMSIFVSWFPMLLLIGVWIFFMRQMQGGGRGGAFSFGKSKARMLDENNNNITFADVAGCDEAKEEVTEIVEFLRDPSKFQKLGGRIPRGVLMVGSP
ncbi:MAG: ATP-dependent zinc metalloprotease FtsH, partial [Pseudomonadota bacterium]